MFGDVVESSIHVGGRKWYVVPLTIVVYTVITAAAVIVPLLAAGVLPTPHDIVIYRETMKVMPVPPAVRTAKGPVVHHPDPNPGPPLEPPVGFNPEPPTQPKNGTDDGIPGNDPTPPPGFIPGGEFVPPPPPPPPPAEPKPIPRVGGDLRPPSKVRDVKPVYPAIAQSARVQGMVIIEATINANGRVVNAKILRSIPLLDGAALDAVRQWEFTPPTLNGQSTPVIMTVTVNFTLQ